MKTLTLKLPNSLETRLNFKAKESGLSKSEIVREALLNYLMDDKKAQTGSFLELAKDLAGSVEGPIDLSENEKYLEDYGQ